MPTKKHGRGFDRSGLDRNGNLFQNRLSLKPYCEQWMRIVFRVRNEASPSSYRGTCKEGPGRLIQVGGGFVGAVGVYS